jgi:hypothetical protein
MIFRIPSGKHYARPWRFGLWWNRQQWTWKVKFTDSCQYELGTVDQLDTNKLCGVGYFPGFHHVDSARFGWRYWPNTGYIELIAYCYIGGKRVIENIEFCEVGKLYELQLSVTEQDYVFNVIDPVFGKPVGGITIEHGHKKKLGYGLWPYFGGNQVAPQEIKIELIKL